MNSSAANKKLLTESLKLEQYQELANELVLRNDTSGVAYLESKLIKIDELREESICITLPKNICQNGHSLTLAIFQENLKKPLLKFPSPESKNSITLIGKVVQLDSLNDQKVSVEVKFTQYKSLEWKNILNMFNDQQDKITSLIEEVKK